MNMIQNRIFLLLAILFFSCKPRITGIPAGEEFLLGLWQEATIETAGGKMLIRFNEVLEDSRCPQDTKCVWAGRVTLQLLIDRTRKVEITNEATDQGRRIILLKVEPVPRLGLDIRAKDYQVKLKVLK
jgi:hypothetical protein